MHRDRHDHGRRVPGRHFAPRHQLANNTPGPDVINLPAGIYTLSITGTSEDDNQTGDLDITDSLTITGAGAATTIIDGDSIDRVMHILNSTTVVTLSDLTVQNGLTNDIGGGILNEATLNLNDSTVAGNEAFKGGGVYHTGGLTLTATRTTLSGNIRRKGAGFLNNSGDLFFIDSTISGNNADVQGGGGIHTGDNMSLTAPPSAATPQAPAVAAVFSTAHRWRRSTARSAATWLTAAAAGSATRAGATLDLLNVTITDNTADFDNDGAGDGGGVFDSTGAFQARNTIVAGNIDQGEEGPDIFGTLNSLGSI